MCLFWCSQKVPDWPNDEKVYSSLNAKFRNIILPLDFFWGWGERWVGGPYASVGIGFPVTYSRAVSVKNLLIFRIKGMFK